MWSQQDNSISSLQYDDTTITPLLHNVAVSPSSYSNSARETTTIAAPCLSGAYSIFFSPALSPNPSGHRGYTTHYFLPSASPQTVTPALMVPEATIDTYLLRTSRRSTINLRCLPVITPNRPVIGSSWSLDALLAMIVAS